MKITKTLISLYIIFTIIVIFVFYLEFSKNDNEDNNKYIAKCGTQPITIIPIIFNNTTKNFEFEIGPILDIDGNPIECGNVSIKFNETMFYNLTNLKGYAKICIPKYLNLTSEFNIKKEVLVTSEGYEDLKFVIYLKYP